MLKRIPTGRLVVLGEPGSGKSILLVHLLLDLITEPERKRGSTVPVIVQLASWNPDEQSFRSWVISELILDYPDLKNPWRSSTRHCTLAEALIDKHLLLLILDGLDEIPVEIRDAAITRLNEFLIPGMSLVLSCRTEDYRNALKTSGSPGAPAKLRGAAGVCLCPLDNDDIEEYLLQDSDDRSEEFQRWKPVLSELSSNTAPVAEALRTPLIVSLARLVYNPRPGETDNSAEVFTPGDLCNTKRFPNHAAIEAHLFRALVQGAYRPRDDRKKNHWNPKAAERWLRFLASHLRDNPQGRNRLAWWELRDSGPIALVPAVIGTICGIASGLAAGFGQHVGFGIGIGLGVGAFVGLGISIPIRKSSKHKGRPSEGIAGALIGGITGGFLGAVASKLGFGHAVWPFGGLAVSLAIAIGVGSSTNFVGGLTGALFGAFFAAVLEGVGRGWPAGLMNGLGMGLCAAMAATFVGRRVPAYRLYWSPLGAVCGLVIGVAVGLIANRAAGPVLGVPIGIAVGFLSAVPCGLSARRRPEQVRDKLTVLSPRKALSHDCRTFYKTAPTAGLAAAIAGLLGGGLVAIDAVKAHPSLGNVITNGLWIGVAAGIIIGLGFGLHHAASVFFVITRYWFAIRRDLPWRLMKFLADAHQERSILRQSGSVYQFRHDALMDWLAGSTAQYWPKTTGRETIMDGTHPVIEVLKARKVQASLPGQRQDNFRVGLAVEGGGMRGILSGAMLAALADCGLTNSFDCIYACSSGAINSAYFVAGGGWHSLSVYYDDLVSKQFLSYRRLLRHDYPVSLDFVFNTVMEERNPLDYEKVMSSPIELHLIASSIDRAKPVALTGFPTRADVKLALRASASIPIVAGPPVIYRGESFVDGAVLLSHPFLMAEADKCTHVLVIRTRSDNSSAGKLTLDKRYMANRLDHLRSGMKDAVISTVKQYDDVAAQIRARSAAGDGPPYVLDVGCPEGSHQVGRLTQDRALLYEGMRVAYGSMLEAVTGEPANILLRPFGTNAVEIGIDDVRVANPAV